MKESKKFVNEVFSYLAAGDARQAETCIADDFKATILNNPVDKTQYISAFTSLKKGIPDLSIRLHDIEEMGDGSKVYAWLDLSGTHSAEIPASVPGFTRLSPSGKKVTAENVRLEISMRDHKISEIKSVEKGRGVFNEVFSQLTA
jgi:ketosteroid isomerase-like protein